MLVLVVVSVVLLVKNGSYLNLTPFEPSHSQGLQRPGSGLPARGVPVHWLGELGGTGRGDRQSAAQRTACGVLSVALMAVSYVLFAYATVSGFHYNGAALSATSDLIPFITVAHGALASLAVWALGHLIGGHGGSMNALTFFDESGTMGTILILVVYFLANLALPFYYRKYRPQEFSNGKHLVLPILGMIAIAIPVYYLCKPPQLPPADWFPWVALGILVLSVAYSASLTRRDPSLGDRVGSIVADE